MENETQIVTNGGKKVAVVPKNGKTEIKPKHYTIKKKVFWWIIGIQLAIIIILSGSLIYWYNWYIGSVKAYKYVYATCRIWMDDFKYTGYTLSERECSKSKSHPNYGVTYSGFPVMKGLTVAVDPRVIPLGSFILPIDNSGEQYVAHDTGNGVNGSHIDVYCGNETKDNLKLTQKIYNVKRPTIIIERRKKNLKIED